MNMPTPEEARVIKKAFADAVETSSSGHKVIAAAKTLRELYSSLSEPERMDLLVWVRLRSPLDSFVSGEDRAYYVQVAVQKKGLRRANLEHLERYSSEETGFIKGVYDDNDEYTFNIWKSEWRYIEGFLKQFEMVYRIVSESSEDHLSPQTISGRLS
ncbi:MAG TPA: hypothetical protein VK658_06745 [Chryseolinea sp.]|nr:hypothetical protein [Chryseolinea sp.]